MTIFSVQVHPNDLCLNEYSQITVKILKKIFSQYEPPAKIIDNHPTKLTNGSFNVLKILSILSEMFASRHPEAGLECQNAYRMPAAAIWACFS